MKAFTKRSLLRLAVLFTVLAGVIAMMLAMPGKSYRGDLPPLGERDLEFREELRTHVEVLAGEIGPRNVWQLAELAMAADYIEGQLRGAGYEVERQGYDVRNVTCYNLVSEIRGKAKPDEIVVIGAHYDSIPDCPAANDNGSGVAALLALAKSMRGSHPDRTLRFVAFVNEEPPFFQTPEMGSFVYAKGCKERGENVVAMVSLETVGYYAQEAGSQSYPFPFNLIYPDTGNFIAFVSTTSSRKLVRQVVKSFRKHGQFPSEGVAVPGVVPGVTWSDHWSFIQHGYPAVMVTDTAPYRYPYYHLTEDTPDKLDYDGFARVVAILEKVIADLAL